MARRPGRSQPARWSLQTFQPWIQASGLHGGDRHLIWLYTVRHRVSAKACIRASCGLAGPPAGTRTAVHSQSGMPALPTLQVRPATSAALPVATAAAIGAVAAPPPRLLHRSISAGNQAMQQPVVSAPNGVADAATAASSESLKAHATALKVSFAVARHVACCIML